MIARLTYEDVNEIRQQSEKGICHIDNDSFKLFFESRPVGQIDPLLNEIKQGQINIGGNIRTSELVDGLHFINNNEGNSFVHKMVYSNMASNAMTTILRLGITQSEMSIRKEKIDYCFDMQLMNRSNNVLILLPIYYRRLPLIPEEQGKYLGKFQIHKSLIKDVRAVVRVSPDGEIRKFKFVEDVDLTEVSQE